MQYEESEEQGIKWCQIAEIKEQKIPVRQRNLFGMFVGVVTKVSEQAELVIFNVCDFTGSAEAVLYQPEHIYRNLQPFPSEGDSIQVLGGGSRKFIGSTEFVRITINSIKIIPVEIELQFAKKCQNQAQKRLIRNKLIESQAKTIKNNIYKEKAFTTNSEILQLKSIILASIFIVFEENPDIKSYVFTNQMISQSKFGKQFQQKDLIQQDTFLVGIDKVLTILERIGMLKIKEAIPQQETIKKKEIHPSKSPSKVVLSNKKMAKSFVSTRAFFTQIEKIIMIKVQNQQKLGGILLQDLSSFANNELCIFLGCQQTLFDNKFLMLVLQKLLRQNKICKTAEKKIVPVDIFQ